MGSEDLSKADLACDVMPVPSTLELGSTSTIAKDAIQLEELGYEQEMKRDLTVLSTIGLTQALMAYPFSLLSTMFYVIVCGGPAGMIYNWIVTTGFLFCWLGSLAEFTSTYPVAGSVYYWTAMVSSIKRAPLFCFVVAWVAGAAQLFIVAAGTFAFGPLIFSLVQIWHPDFVFKPYQVVLLFWIASTIGVVGNLPGHRASYLHRLDLVSMWYNIAASIIIVVVLLATAKERNSAHYVFAEYDSSLSGWPSGWAFFLGSLAPLYAITAPVGIPVVAEEVKDARRSVPRAMMVSLGAGSIGGLAFFIGIFFVFPRNDIEALLSVQSGQPAAMLFYLATGSKGVTTGLMVLVLISWFLNIIATQTCASRFIWGVARDSPFPFSKWLSTLHPTYKTPMNALIAINGINCLLGLIYLGSVQAWNAFLGFSLSCIIATSFMPILLLVLGRRRAVADAAFPLGRFGYFANIVTLAWCILIAVVACSPAVIPTSAPNMNYASVLFGFFFLLAAIIWFLHGRQHFKGPKRIQIAKEQKSDQSL